MVETSQKTDRDTGDTDKTKSNRSVARRIDQGQLTHVVEGAITEILRMAYLKRSSLSAWETLWLKLLYSSITTVPTDLGHCNT